MADGYALASDVTQNLADLAGAANTANLGAKQVMSWDGTNLKWRNQTITAWPSTIPDTQVVELTGFATLDKVPSWVPKGKTNIHVLLPATTGVATLDSSGNVTANVPASKVTGQTGTVAVSGSTLTFTSPDGTKSTATLPASTSSTTPSTTTIAL